MSEVDGYLTDWCLADCLKSREANILVDLTNGQGVVLDHGSLKASLS